jgi:thioredoxin reductase (NADPH)
MSDDEVVADIRTDAYGDRDTGGAFPILDAAALRTLGSYGDERPVQVGETLFAPGDKHQHFFVVLDGEVTIYDGVLDGEHRVVTVHTPGRFIGDTTVLSHQAATLTARVTKSGTVLQVSDRRLRDIMTNEPALSEVIMRAFLLRHTLMAQVGVGVRVIGSRYDASSRALLHFLSQNRVAVSWMDVETDADAEQLLQRLEVGVDDIPIVVTGRGLLRRPSLEDVAHALGIGSCVIPRDDDEICDLVVVGGGPAGLAAAVYGASEGLATVLVDGTALGGQAGTSSRIENYLGFPAGLSGEELATRAALQAEKFEARIMVPREATGLSHDGVAHVIDLNDGTQLRSHAVIVATGANYRRLSVPRLEDFEGAGVYYAATPMEVSLCADQPVAIVGGGNSAGQAAVYLSGKCRKVSIVIRRDSLQATMSRYLIDQIERDRNIQIIPNTEVTELIGDHALTGVRLRDNTSMDERLLDATGLFAFIGADPCTGWLDDQLASEGGFLYTGSDIPAECLETGGVPLPLETSRAGIFCVGDARFGSVKRVASAVGEGSMAVRMVHERAAHPIQVPTDRAMLTV